MSDSFTKEEQLLITEAKLINAMLLEGLDCLRQSNFGKQGLYYQAFYSISYGMERLLKLIIIEDYRSKNDNKMPNNGYLKKYSHDICEMVSDYALGVMDNEINKRIITFFSNFACKSRYYNLNMLTGGYNEFLNPLEEWRNIEDLILQKYNKKVKKIENREQLASMLDQDAYVYISGMRGETIRSFKDVLLEYETINERQEYSVLVCFKIIQELVFILSKIELDYHLYPYLWEVFSNLRGTYTNTEIRKKKRWRDLIR